jgi:hypothetical protein
MVVECQLNHTEMREAFRLNLTPSFWFKAVFSNIRAVFILCVVLAMVVHDIIHKDTQNWGAITMLYGFAAVLIGIYLLKTLFAIKKTVAKHNEAYSRITLDSQGVSTANDSGATSFVPWSQYKRWKEGKLVFTIGDIKAFKTLPKSKMSDAQISEVRGILQAQIC